MDDPLDILSPLFYLEKKHRGKHSPATVNFADLNQNRDDDFRELSLAPLIIVLPCS